MQHIIQEWKEEKREEFDKKYPRGGLQHKDRWVHTEVKEFISAQMTELLTLLEEGTPDLKTRLYLSEAKQQFI